MTDREIIERKVDIIEENMAYLRQVAGMDPRTFESSFERVQATKHCLQEAVDACLDIANHIISAEGFPRAEEYGQFFIILAEKKVISKALAARLEQMAKFRNLLVHRYGIVDAGRLHTTLKEDLDDIEGYIKAILKHVSSKG